MASNRHCHSRDAQSVAEYSVLAAIVIVAIAGMLVYVQRGLQGRYKNAVDAAQAAAGSAQYEPLAVTEALDQQFSQSTSQTFSAGGRVVSDGSTSVVTGYDQDIPVQ